MDMKVAAEDTRCISAGTQQENKIGRTRSDPRCTRAGCWLKGGRAGFDGCVSWQV